MKRLTKLILICVLSTTGLFALTACNPVLSLNPEYSYSDLHIEVGQPIPTSVEDFIDLSQYTDEEKDYILKHTTVECDGIDPSTGAISAMGEYTLVIKYCGTQYRSYKITVSDTTPPTIAYSGDLYTFKGMELKDSDIKKMFTATDNSGSVDLQIDSQHIDIKTVGEYTITATATDPSGNVATATGKLIVQQPSRNAKGTFIYISIAEQTLSYIENNQVVLTSPVVSGCVAAGNDTPKGIYRVTNKARNTSLKGEGYESFVSYWIGFIGGMVGMHDASWRSEFGGNIYKYDGSHGCVNMPYSKVSQLYGMVSSGTIVIVD